VLRAEITATRPFLRTTEFLWQEGHTVHATKEDADQEVLMILGFYRDLIEQQLAVPVLTGYKSEREKFVGALYTTTLEAMMPDGKAIQMVTSHNLGQNFSKPFEIKYLGKDEQLHYAWTTSWGVSWRLLSALIMLHGDDRGLIVPPHTAPIQIVIVPIHFKDRNKEGINEKTRKVTQILKSAGFRVHLDDREQYTPGWKFNEWELKGIHIRIEVGPRDVERKQVTLVRRDNFQKVNVNDDALVEEARKSLESIQITLFEKASLALKASIRQAANYDEFKQIIETNGGFVRACWCGSSECEDAIKNEIGATIRTLPFQDEVTFAACVKCGKPSTKVGYFARSY